MTREEKIKVAKEEIDPFVAAGIIISEEDKDVIKKWCQSYGLDLAKMISIMNQVKPHASDIKELVQLFQLK